MPAINRPTGKRFERYNLAKPEDGNCGDVALQDAQEYARAEATGTNWTAIVLAVAAVLILLVAGAAAIWAYSISNDGSQTQQQPGASTTQPETPATASESIQAAYSPTTTLEETATTAAPTQPAPNNYLKAGDTGESIPGRTVNVGSIVKVAQYGGQKADRGYVFILARVNVANGGGEKFYARRTDFSMTDSEGNLYNAETPESAEDYPKFQYITELTAGQNVWGYVLFTVPDGSQGLMIHYFGGKDQSTGKAMLYNWEV